MTNKKKEEILEKIEHLRLCLQYVNDNGKCGNLYLIGREIGMIEVYLSDIKNDIINLTI